MKKKILSLIGVFLFGFGISMAQETFSPFLKTAEQNKSIESLAEEISSALKLANFNIVGQYKPMHSGNLQVICFTRKDLQSASLSFKDRGALASVLKIGLQKTASGVSISILNPMYMFYGYFQGNIAKQMTVLKQIDKDAKQVLSDKFGKLTPFGGELTSEKLVGYHYKVMMPYFTDPTILETYSSFEEGLKHIQSKLANSPNVEKVYMQLYKEEQIAVFGLGLTNKEKGEASFLPIIGESHVAALPYEIILQGKDVSMLPGKYRIALFWPELTMGTFMKIMSTPGDIESFFLEVTKK